MTEKILRFRWLIIAVMVLAFVPKTVQAQTTVTLEPPSSGDGTVSNPYQIASAGNLYWFAALVNGTLMDGTQQNAAACAVLIQNIEINSKVIDADGNLKDGHENLAVWTPIGDSSQKYTGTFNGQGYTVSGLYLYDDNRNYIGFFGWLDSGGIIMNVGVEDSFFQGYSSVGGVCGHNESGTISNCYNAGTVSTIQNSASVGGVCGVSGKEYVSGVIKNCYNVGKVCSTGPYASVGGVCGKNLRVMLNCYNAGVISGTGDMAQVAGVCGRNSGNISNCYYRNGETGDPKKGIGENYGEGFATGKTAGEFANGFVAWLLNGNIASTSVDNANTSPWLQNLNGDKKDDCPALTAKDDKCIAVKPNTENDSAKPYVNFDTHSYVNATPADYPEIGTNNLHSQVCDHCKDASTALLDKKVIKCLNGKENIVITKDNDAWKTEETITLSDEASYNAPVDFIVSGASYSREISTKWATLCLPNAIEAKTTDYKTYQLSVVGDENITLTEVTDAYVAAGTPVFVMRTGTATTVNFNATAIDDNVTMMKTPDGSSCTDDKKLTGVFKETTLSTTAANDYLFIKEDKMWSVAQAGKDMKVKPFRAYIEASSASSVPQRSIAIDGEATAISDALDTLNDTNAEYYDMSGRRISSLQKGVNIIRSGNKTRKVVVQ